MPPRLVGFIPCYNEADIIGETLQYYADANVPVVVVDNGSTDGTSEIVQRHLGGEVLSYIRPETDEYDLRNMLDTCLALVEQQRPDWIMHIDADHLYEPGHGFGSFVAHVEDATARACNVIDFEEYVFLPTPDDPPDASRVYDRIKHYAFRAPGVSLLSADGGGGEDSGRDGGSHLMQPRVYRYRPGMNISNDGGHTIFFPNEPMISHPVRGVLRHYMFRSVEHANRKLRERRARYSRAGRARGWHTQYDTWQEDDSSFIRPGTTLIKRIEGEPWRRDVMLTDDGSVVHRP